jgi:hypothetical protein
LLKGKVPSATRKRLTKQDEGQQGKFTQLLSHFPVSSDELMKNFTEQLEMNGLHPNKTFLKNISFFNFLQLLCVGASIHAITSLSKTWDSTEHFIKMKYGMSELSYKNSMTTPLYGPGQGSTIGPFLWLSIFCLIVDSFNDNTPKMHFKSTDGNLSISNDGEAFVDDSYLGCMSNYLTSDTEPISLSYDAYSAIENLTKKSQT